MTTNIGTWQRLQDENYFYHHHVYAREGGLLSNGLWDLGVIEHVISLNKDMVAVVIGCGYGRETISISKAVRLVYGIDVSEKVLSLFRTFARQNGVDNVVPILASDYESSFDGLEPDLVYSVNVFQHITRNQTCDYVRFFVNRLKKSGVMLAQFAECGGTFEPDPLASEPNVKWTRGDIEAMSSSVGAKCGIETNPTGINPEWVWHWATLRKS